MSSPTGPTSDSTVLILDPIGTPDYSARGITETLEVLGGDLRRTINGELLNLTPTQFRKFRLTWSCDDMDSPALNAIYPGDLLTVAAITELGYLTATGSPDRPVADGSSRIVGIFTFYRPVLDVRVASWQIETNEWGAATGWRMVAEEL